MNQVLILHARLPGDVACAAADELLARLPYARRLELERRDAAGRLASLAGAALVLAGAGRMRGRRFDPAQLRFAPGRAPTLEGGPRFSVSHSHGRVGVALCDDGAVGLDLEEPASVGDTAGARLGSIERWTAIEAVLKAAGAGLREAGRVQLSEDRSSASFADEVFHLHPLALAAGCIACLATQSPAATAIVEEVAIPWPAAAGNETD